MESLKICSQGLVLVIVVREPEVNVGIVLLFKMVVNGGHPWFSGVQSTRAEENFIVVEAVSREVIKNTLGTGSYWTCV